MSHFYMGIDVGNTNSELSVLDEDAECVYAETVPTLSEPFWREDLSLFAGHQLHAAFEIGTHYPWLCALLKEYCCEVVVVNAGAFEVISKAQYKTDKIDAPKLAMGLWRGDLPEVFVPDERQREDRRLVSHLHELSRMTGRLKTRLRDSFYAARKRCPYSDLFGQDGQTWLKETLPQLPSLEKLMAEQEVEQLKLLEQQRAKMDKLMAERMQAYVEAPLMRSVPGFGPLVIVGVLSAIASIKRFTDGDHLASYFGLCGAIYQSGDTLRQGHITKHGNKHVRWLLGQAVTHLIRKDAKVRKKYLKLKKKKNAKVARVAIMRWLTTILWHMLTHKEQYRLGGIPGNYLVRKGQATVVRSRQTRLGRKKVIANRKNMKVDRQETQAQKA